MEEILYPFDIIKYVVMIQYTIRITCRRGNVFLLFFDTSKSVLLLILHLLPRLLLSPFSTLPLFYPFKCVLLLAWTSVHCIFWIIIIHIFDFFFLFFIITCLHIHLGFDFICLFPPHAASNLVATTSSF